MEIKLHEEYYFWCCDWCDTENRVHWTKLQDGADCGACHRRMQIDSSGWSQSVCVGDTSTGSPEGHFYHPIR